MSLASVRLPTGLRRSWGQLLLSDARRIVRTLGRLFRENPLVLMAVITVTLTIGILVSNSGEVLAALASGRTHGLTSLSVATLAVGAALGFTAASSCPRLSAYDGQFRAAPVSHQLVAVPLLLVPVAVMLAAPAFVLALAVVDVYDALQVPPPWLWATVFAVWFVTLGMIGAAISVAFAGDRHARLVGVLLCALVGVAGLIGSAHVGAPSWAWPAPFLPWGPAGALPNLVRPDAGVSGGAAILACVTACAVMVWARGREPRSAVALPRSHVLPWPRRGASLALALWLVVAALRSPRARWALFAPALGVLIGLAVRASGDPGGLFGSVVAAGLLLATGEVAISLSREYRLGRWLVDSSLATASSRAFGWLLGAGAVASVLGLLAVSPLVLLGAAGLNELAWIGAATFAAVFAGRLLPWDHRSTGIQFLSSITAGVCVIAALALDAWLVRALGPGVGHTVALLAAGASASAGILGMEVGNDR